MREKKERHLATPSRLGWLTRVFALSALLGSMSGLQAQISLVNARATAMAGAYGAISRGAEAVLLAPANLGLRSRPDFSLLLPGAGAYVQNSSFTLDDYRKYNGAFLDDADKQALLSKIPSSGLAIAGDAQAMVLGLSAKKFAVNVTTTGASDINLAKDFVELALQGNAFGREYRFDGSRGRAWALTHVGFSFGQPVDVVWIEDLAAGFTFKYVHGWSYAEVVRADGSLITDFDGLRSDGRLEMRTATGGDGYAADIGISGKISEQWSFAWMWNNVISGLKWKKDVRIYEYGVTADSITIESLSASAADSLYDTYAREYAGEPFRTSLSGQIRLSTVYKKRSFLLVADYIQGFRNAPGVSRKPQLSVGGEYSGLAFLPLRAGVAVGGKTGFATTFGFGLRLAGFSVNFAAVASKSVVPSTGPGVGLVFDVKFGVD